MSSDEIKDIDSNSAATTPSREDRAQEALLGAAEKLIRVRKHELLLVEDTAAHAAIIRRAVNPNVWQIEHVTRAGDAVNSFERNPERIVLLDLSLPDNSGLQLLVRLRQINPDAPFIVCTSTDQVAVSVEAMQRGAWDYVVKGEPKETSERIVAAIERAWKARLHLAETQLIERTRLVELVRSQRLEAIETIVRTVCHEVNNPLSGVVALSQLLRQNDKLDVDLQRLADGIIRSAKEVADVVQKLKHVGDQVVEFGGREIFSTVEDDSSVEAVLPKP